MRARLLALLLFAANSLPASAQAAQMSWVDLARDVYLDGEIDRAAQVLSSDAPRRIALISPRLDRAVVLDLNLHTVGTMSKEAFRFAPDRASATSEAGAALEPAGKYTAIDGYTYLFAVDGKPALIRLHQGATGEVSLEKLFETVPVWRSLLESYQPQPATVAALKAHDKEATVTVVLGTWCPDSRNYVPRLLKSLSAAGNDKLRLKIIGIDSQFHEPVATIQQRRIVNVPTVIVERDGREIGRIIETPAAENMEQDLAAILSGKPVLHNGRWDRGPRLARGVYSYKDQAGIQRGEERWELFSTAEGGWLAHSEITNGEMITEVWHRVDARRRPTFVEVTRRRGAAISRVRYRIGEQTMTARFRGSEGGVIEQTLSVPDQFSFSMAVAAEGWGRGPRAGSEVTSYLAPQEFEAPVGALAAAAYEAKETEAVRSPAGEFRARHILRKTAKGTWEWWLHPELGFPVRGRSPGGMEYLLSSVEIASDGK